MAIALKNYNITTSFKIQAVVVDARSIIWMLDLAQVKWLKRDEKLRFRECGMDLHF
jgi:hypothetical protein